MGVKSKSFKHRNATIGRHVSPITNAGEQTLFSPGGHQYRKMSINDMSVNENHNIGTSTLSPKKMMSLRQKDDGQLFSPQMSKYVVRPSAIPSRVEPNSFNSSKRDV